MIYVFWSCPDQEEAREVIHRLLEKKWIACASILPAVISIYHWQGHIEEAREVKVILKSQEECFQRIEVCIRAFTRYATPEIVAVAVDQCTIPYLEWVLSETSS